MTNLTPAHYQMIADWLGEGAATFDSIAADLAASEPAPDPTPEPEPEPDPAPEPPVTGPGPDRPTLVLDAQATAEDTMGRLICTFEGEPSVYWHHPKGCIVQVPETAVPIPSPNRAIRINRNAVNMGLEEGAVFTFRGGRFQSPGNQLCMTVTTDGHPVPRFTVQMEDMQLVGGPDSGSSGHTLSVTHPCDVELRRMILRQGYNCLFASNGDITITADECDFLQGAGNGNGHGHNIYIGYIRRFVMRNSRTVGPRSLGHALKCYAARYVIDGNYIRQAETDDGMGSYRGTLPPVDLGAFANGVFAGNTVIRNAVDARPDMAALRNRRYANTDIWPGEPDYHTIDNRDPQSPGLLHHFFIGNKFINNADGGWILRNNGTAPGRSDLGEPVPAEWQPHYHRAVAWMVGNEISGTQLIAQAYNRSEWRRPEAGETPIHDVETLPEWALAKIADIEAG